MYLEVELGVYSNDHYMNIYIGVQRLASNTRENFLWRRDWWPNLQYIEIKLISQVPSERKKKTIIYL